jgi:hypothetical protein
MMTEVTPPAVRIQTCCAEAAWWLARQHGGLLVGPAVRSTDSGI